MDSTSQEEPQKDSASLLKASMMLIARYRIHDFPSDEKDKQIIKLVGAHYLVDGAIETNEHGSMRLLRFFMPTREDAYFAAVLLETEITGVQADVESSGAVR